MKILLSFLSILLFVNCTSDDDENSNINPETITYKLLVNSQITEEISNEIILTQINAGDKLVFNYIFSAEDQINIADDEYAERIFFEIDASLDSFTLNGQEELSAAKAYFEQSCFCESLGSLPITQGAISGRKLDDNSWQVDIQVSFVIRDTLDNRTVSGVFKP